MEVIATLPPVALYTAAPFAAIALLLLAVRTYTTIRFHQALKQFSKPAKPGVQHVTPPQIPYTLPWLGNTLDFVTDTPGKFWKNLFSWYPRSAGVCTILVGGRSTHILFSPPAVQALFKARAPSRDVFEHDLYEQIFILPKDQVHLAMSTKHLEHEMNNKYLTNFERVNELTAEFTKTLRKVLDRDAEVMVHQDQVALWSWLRDRLFTASTTALMGDRILKVYPEFGEDFFGFDYEFLQFFFRMPKFMLKEAYARRERLFTKLKAWAAEMRQLSGGAPIDPDGPAWEPYFGSRLNRARQINYKNRNLDGGSSAALDLGLVFGLSSNAIPATCWMIFEILKPTADPTILSRVMEELKQAEKPDGSIDVPTLVAQPLLQSLWTETLRMHTDVLVTRNCPEDITLPLDDDGKRQVTFRKGDNIFAPCYLGHHDANVWSNKSPENVFDAERFCSVDPKTGKETFSISGTTGKYFPFGGGKTICPGRTFAKQEALGAFAMIMLQFDFEVLGFIDADKKPTSSFPGYNNAYPGSGVIVPGGDVLVKLRRRQQCVGGGVEHR